MYACFLDWVTPCHDCPSSLPVLPTSPLSHICCSWKSVFCALILLHLSFLYCRGTYSSLHTVCAIAIPLWLSRHQEVSWHSHGSSSTSCHSGRKHVTFLTLQLHLGISCYSSPDMLVCAIPQVVGYKLDWRRVMVSNRLLSGRVVLGVLLWPGAALTWKAGKRMHWLTPSVTWVPLRTSGSQLTLVAFIYSVTWDLVRQWGVRKIDKTMTLLSLFPKTCLFE